MSFQCRPSNNKLRINDIRRTKADDRGGCVYSIVRGLRIHREKDFLVIPWVPTRQWVVSVPIPLRYWMAPSRELTAKVHTIISRTISQYYVNQAVQQGATRATVHGFSLHAKPHIPAHRRDQLERLIRYTARDSVSLGRLEETANGDLIYTFPKPWSDGTTGIQLSPLELLETSSAIVVADLKGASVLSPAANTYGRTEKCALKSLSIRRRACGELRRANADDANYGEWERRGR